MTQEQLKEEAREEFEKKWKRIESTMTGHVSGRKLWDVDPDDEDGYLFVDETLQELIDSLITKAYEEGKKETIKPMSTLQLSKKVEKIILEIQELKENDRNSTPNSNKKINDIVETLEMLFLSADAG